MNIANMKYTELVQVAKQTKNIKLEKAPHQTPKEVLIQAIEKAAKKAATQPKTPTKKSVVLEAIKANPEADVNGILEVVQDSVENLRKGYVRRLLKKYPNGEA